MGWGIVYPPYSVINMGVAQPPTPATRWVYNFNGVNTYIDTGGYTYSGDFWVEVKAQLPTQLPASNQAFFGGNGSNSTDPGSFAAMITSSGLSVQIPTPSGLKFGLTDSLAGLLGSVITLKVERVSSLFSLSVNGTVVDTFETSGFGVIDMKVIFIARWFTLYHYSGQIYDYKDSLGNNLPINDRTFGVGAVIKNTGSGADATGINLLESGWQEINT